MNKLFPFIPLLAISFLTSCGNKEPIKKYSITWKMDDGTILRTDQVEYDKMPDYGKAPTKDSTAQYDYTFDGWNPSITKVTSDATYTAKFTETIREYKVTVSSEDESKGTVTGGGPHGYGSSVTIKATPKTGYKFAGWYEDESKASSDNPYTFPMPANDVNYTAKFNVATPWYQREDWWNYCSNDIDGEQAVAEDIGKEVNLIVNNQIHKVRLIDINHDVLSDDASKTAHCTFEFANLLSDESGYSLATLWDSRDGKYSFNFDYLNSDLKKALDGQGTGKLRWYQKGLNKKSTELNYTKPVINMLPDEIKNNIKKVKKYVAKVASYAYTVKDYDTKVFALTYREITANKFPYAEEEGSTYQYYKDHNDASSRIKHQIKWHKDAATISTKITDLTWNPDNYAGYNSSAKNYGGDYWLTSPNTGEGSAACQVGEGGDLPCDYIYNVAYAVAPAFCI